MSSRHRARWAVLLACAALVTVAAPTSAQTQRDADAVLLARTLADGFTAIEARRADARAAVEAWDADQVRCANPRLRSGRERAEFRGLRTLARHSVALHALAPELRQLVTNLKALPVTDPAIRGGIAEVRLDYRHAREAIDYESPTLCAIAQAVRLNQPLPPGISYGEEVRSTIRGLSRRSKRLRAAQRALLRVEVDPRLARSLDTVFGHATAGLFPAPHGIREHLAPPFAIVTDPGELARLRAEASEVAAATGTLAKARRGVARQIELALGRSSHCVPALRQGLRHRPRQMFDVVARWIFGEFAAATAEPGQRFLADVRAVRITDAGLGDIVAGAADELEEIAAVPRVDLCGELRARRRAGWPRRPGIRLDGEAFAISGIRLEQDTMDRALLRRRGMPRTAARALIDPLAFLLEGLTTTSQASTPSLRAIALQALR